MSEKTSKGAFACQEGRLRVTSRPALSTAMPAGRESEICVPWNNGVEVRANKRTCVRARARFAPALSPAKTMDCGGMGS